MNLQEKDKAYVWHPFTQMKNASDPIHIIKAEGIYLYSSYGKKYIDAVSSWWVNLHGHSNPIIAEAIARQAKELEHVIFAGFTHEPAISLAEKLIDITGKNYSKVFYSDNGSTAVEVGIKMALQYWHNKGETKKIKIIALEGAYHGDTFGAMSAAERNTFNAAFHQLLFDVKHIPLPNANNIDKCISKLESFAKEENIAAFIFEPLVQGAGGMRMYEAKYLDQLISIAKKNNIICIADEVMTGFGRTGKLFASEYLNQKAEIICLSKGITGGFMPLGATLCNEEIYNAFLSDSKEKTFYHGHSYTANPLACAAALSSMEILTSDECLKSIDEISSSNQTQVEHLQKNEFIKNARATGTILAFEFNTSENSSYFNSIRDEAYNFCLSKGVLLRPLGNTLYLMPPYCINNDELNKVYTVMQETADYLKEKTKLN